MKTTYLLMMALVLVGCSSADKKKKNAEQPISQEMFKKETPLKNSEVSDFYTGNQGALNPALQDETLDRYTAEEISRISGGQDPLLEISLACSRGDFDRAFAVASKSFEKYQKIPSYWNMVANCHLKQGSYRKSLLFYNKALEVKPNYVPALNNIGVMYSRQGQDQKALVAFERAYKQSKFAKTPRYNLGKLYLTYGLADLALPLFEGLLSQANNDVDLLNAVAASHFIKSDYNAALAAYQKIPNELWSRPEIGINLALTLHLAGRKDDARKVFDYIKDPKAEELKRYYAIVEKQMGENK